MTERKKVTLNNLFKKASQGKPVTWLTCYDYPTAHFQEEAGIDMILVGDSLAMTMLGYDSTLPATMDDMIRHTQAVRRGSPNAFLVGDMPYMTYQPFLPEVTAGSVEARHAAVSLRRHLKKSR